jgi:hypothetical protein
LPRRYDGRHPAALSARLITIVETSSWSVEPLGTSQLVDNGRIRADDGTAERVARGIGSTYRADFARQEWALRGASFAAE